MAAPPDARTLLRAARKDRRITHPHASYTTSGTLLCNLCEVPVKSEAAWGGHLHSTGHTLRLSRAQEAARRSAEAETGNGRKRKAGSPAVEDEVEEGSKRVRFGDEGITAPAAEDGAKETEAVFPSALVPDAAPQTMNAQEAAELAAFEADLAALDRESAYTAATISAPALSASDLAAQAREEISAQRGKRDVEIADEKEEAEGRLQDEFAEMEELEGRVRRLRERREGLRTGDGGVSGEGVRGVGGVGGVGDGEGDGREGSEMVTRGKVVGRGDVVDGSANAEADDVDNDDEEEVDEDEETWAFGAR